MIKQTMTILLLLSLCFSIANGKEMSVDKNDFKVLESFEDIYDYIDKDNVKVKVKPGTYQLDRPSAEPMIAFNGSNNYFDLTDVKLIADRPCNTIIALIGNDIVLEGLHLETNKDHSICRSGSETLGFNITGDDNMLLGVYLQIRDSYPYGYGSYFGIGRGASVKLSKSTGIRIGPGSNTVIKDCKVVMNAFGHGIFIRGADNALVENTSVEGLLRQTNEILQEKTGPAFEEGFIDASGEPIRPGRITSLCEDGIRIYGDSGTRRNYGKPDKKPTGSVTVRNCSVNRMRRGICLALGGSGHVVENCTVSECTRVGYNIGSDTIVKNCRGDAKYCQLLDIASSGSKNSVIELEVLDSKKRQKNSFENDPDLLAKVNGSGHTVKIKPVTAEAVPTDMNIEIGGNVGWASDEDNIPVGKSIRLDNRTDARVLLHPAAEACIIRSSGPVVDYGSKNNTVIDSK
ncbi:MAG: right-handed parallel beta-helix repeat-containing protein [Sedimentisphaeraceae bacterium JB056]